MPDDPAHAWVSISEASRRLGITRAAVRGRVRRGTLDAREVGAGNRRVVQVRVLEGHQGRHQEHVPAPTMAPVEAELRASIARLEAEVAWLRSELDRRRWRWPGLRELWRRVIEGGG